MSSSDPSYCNRNEAGTAYLVVTGLTFGIATIIVPLRIWMRWRRKDCTLGWDDACLVAGYIIAIPAVSLTWRIADLGLGKHESCYTDADLIEAYKLEWIAQDLTLFSAMFTRASVALFVTRLFGTSKKFRIFLYCYTAFQCVSMILCGGLLWGICSDTEAMWNYHLNRQESGCKPGLEKFVDYYNAAVSILTDFLLAMLPSYFLRKLQMPLRKKIGLMVLMGVGLIPMIMAICRTVMANRQWGGDDPLYKTPEVIVFGMTEIIMLIICATIPALLPLFRTFVGFISSSISGSREYEKTT